MILKYHNEVLQKLSYYL